ncbi:MAG TPA: PPC domain-containing protein [Vicinamibacteria bacterium]|nr:PPC domain-containing protein [Vicinamibacteria bacterium]
MRKTWFVAALLVLGLGGMSWAQTARSTPGYVGPRSGEAPLPDAGGDTCATPPTVVTGPLPYTDSGTSCGAANDFTNAGPSACRTSLPFNYPGPDVIYRVNLGAGNSVGYSMSLTGSTGDLALFLLDTCGVDTSCVANSQDAIGPGAGPELIAAAARPAGDYYLYVDSYYPIGNGASCGTYTLTVTGTLPVELQGFTIK